MIVKNSKGVSYLEFRKTLKPRYGRVWRDLAMGYAALIAICFAIGFVPFAPWIAIGLGAASLGYVLAYIQLFLHEAAHFLCAL